MFIIAAWALTTLINYLVNTYYHRRPHGEALTVALIWSTFAMVVVVVLTTLF